MSILLKLASSLNRRDEVPNQELAAKVVAEKNTKAVKELVENLANKDKNIQSDCIKVLDEIGKLKPELISDYTTEFVKLLSNKNNRLVWGSMSVLDSVTSADPAGVYKHLAVILETSDKGSVITKDCCVNILIKLAKEKKYAENAIPLLLEQMQKSFPNQLPMYAENALSVITEKYKKEFVKILTSRLDEVEKDTKKNRILKVIKKVA